MEDIFYMENIFLVGLDSIINLRIPQVFISQAHYLQSQHWQAMPDPAVRNHLSWLEWFIGHLHKLPARVQWNNKTDYEKVC